MQNTNNGIEINTNHTKSSFSLKIFGVNPDEQLSFKDYIKSISSKNMTRLLNRRHIRSHFDKSSSEIIFHLTIISRPDYCNSLLSCLSQSFLYPLQLVQNFTARLICNHSKFSHITPILYELNWIPITCRIKFKMLLFIYKSLNGFFLHLYIFYSYLSSLLTLYVSARPLRSSSADKLCSTY